MKETKFFNHPMQGNLDSEIREIFACAIWNLENFSLWNPESWALESGINLKESEIPLMIGIWKLHVASIRTPCCMLLGKV